jgi:hypothetical protein
MVVLHVVKGECCQIVGHCKRGSSEIESSTRGAKPQGQETDPERTKYNEETAGQGQGQGPSLLIQVWEPTCLLASSGKFVLFSISSYHGPHSVGAMSDEGNHLW